MWVTGSQVLGTIQWFSGKILSLCCFSPMSEVSLQFMHGNRSPSGSEPFPSLTSECRRSPKAGYYHQNKQAQCTGSRTPTEALRKVKKPPAYGAHKVTKGLGAGRKLQEYSSPGRRAIVHPPRAQGLVWETGSEGLEETQGLHLGEKQTMEKVVNKGTKQERHVCAGTGKHC